MFKKVKNLGTNLGTMGTNLGTNLRRRLLGVPEKVPPEEVPPEEVPPVKTHVFTSPEMTNEMKILRDETENFDRRKEICLSGNDKNIATENADNFCDNYNNALTRPLERVNTDDGHFYKAPPNELIKELKLGGKKRKSKKCKTKKRKISRKKKSYKSKSRKNKLRKTT